MRTKSILIIWFLISFIVIFFVGVSQVNTYVSVKYEVDEFLMSGNTSESVQVKQELLENMVFVLWIFGIYLVMNVTLLLILLLKRKYVPVPLGDISKNNKS